MPKSTFLLSTVSFFTANVCQFLVYLQSANLFASVVATGSSDGADSKKGSNMGDPIRAWIVMMPIPDPNPGKMASQHLQAGIHPDNDE